MAGLCEGGNEPAGSLKPFLNHCELQCLGQHRTDSMVTDVAKGLTIGAEAKDMGKSFNLAETAPTAGTIPTSTRYSSDRSDIAYHFKGVYPFREALLAIAHAGGPAAYSTFTAPIGYGSVGSTHESTVKGFGGNSVISQYSKAVDTPYSSVRKYDTRISNDALAYAPAAHAIAAPAVAYGAAPALAYGAGYRAYGAAPALAYGAGYRAYGAAPALAYGAGYRAYGAAPALAYGAGYRAYAAPAAYHGYAAPAAYGVPAYATAYHGAAYAPAVAKAAVAAPLGVAYSAAPAVAHLSFSGLGAAYGY
ncbi:hypothetical protein ANN_16830 [Periplaneta americana]|uniref:Uncharacterized protein n=1 Tax=Periplaneta americana TaxID=6978 RepID=A0ABQ8SS04_PERAM|nr:hypothetical protein ANN_16830 [Periplaneta americana]